MNPELARVLRRARASRIFKEAYAEYCMIEEKRRRQRASERKYQLSPKGRARRRRWLQANRARMVAYSKKWAKANPESIARWHKKRRATLGTGYVKAIVASQLNTQIRDVPLALIELKREQLKLKRKLWNR